MLSHSFHHTLILAATVAVTVMTVAASHNYTATNHTSSNSSWYGGNHTDYNWNVSNASCFAPTNGTTANASNLACSGNGHCYDYGYCGCNAGYYGAQCQYEMNATCPRQGANGANETGSVCSGHGSCYYGSCLCDMGFYGYACQYVENTTINNNTWYACNATTGFGNTTNGTTNGTGCGQHGYCMYGFCYCDDEYYGSHCQFAVRYTCPWGIVTNGTVSHGNVTNTTTNTTEMYAPCSGNGYCLYGHCECYDYSEFYGSACQYRYNWAWNATSNHTNWNNHTNHSTYNNTNPTNWSNHSVCHAAAANYTNGNYSTACGRHGYCLFGHCYCHDGYYGDRCQHMMSHTCPMGSTTAVCSGRGLCSYGMCHCDDGFYGFACQYIASTGYNGTDQWGTPTNHTYANYTTVNNSASVQQCGHHGVMEFERCRCFPDYVGSRCQHYVGSNSVNPPDHMASSRSSKSGKNDADDDSHAMEYGLIAAGGVIGSILVVASVVAVRHFRKSGTSTSTRTMDSEPMEDVPVREPEEVTIAVPATPKKDGTTAEPAMGVPVAFEVEAVPCKPVPKGVDL